MKNFYLWILLLGLAACEKTEPELVLNFPATYRATSFKSNANIRLFTKTGEITDQQVITKFTKKNGTSFLHPNGSTGNISPDQAETIQIETASTAKSKTPSAPFWTKFTIQKKEPLVEFIAQDTTVFFTQHELTVQHFNISKAFFKYTNAFETQMPIPGGGTMYKVVAKRVAYLSEKDKLTLPLLNYVLVNTNPGFSRSTYFYSGLNNEIKTQPDFNQLKVNDTIAWQSLELVFEKQ